MIYCICFDASRIKFLSLCLQKPQSLELGSLLVEERVVSLSGMAIPPEGGISEKLLLFKYSYLKVLSENQLVFVFNIQSLFPCDFLVFKYARLWFLDNCWEIFNEWKILRWSFLLMPRKKEDIYSVFNHRGARTLPRSFSMDYIRKVTPKQSSWWKNFLNVL